MDLERALAYIMGQRVEVESSRAGQAPGHVCVTVVVSVTGRDYEGVRWWAEREHGSAAALVGAMAGGFVITSARSGGFEISYLGNDMWGARVRHHLVVGEEQR